MNAQHLPPEALDAWLTAASDELGLEAAEVPIALILKIAADVAHGVARPAAPLSTFLLGLALGRSDSPSNETLEALSARLSALAAQWDSEANEL